MEWSHGKDRMASVLERLLEPKKEKKTFSQKLTSCFCCFTNKDNVKTNNKSVHFRDSLSYAE